VADMVNVDPCHLSKTFKSIKGVSPMEYLTNLRIDKAKALLSDDSSIMLKDIAEIVGYSNQYYFSRIFKIITGLSPSEYRSSKLNAD
jgi:two-component system, response regulator YesN